MVVVGSVPKPQVRSIHLGDREILVVRDDMVPGGTKVRFLSQLMRRGQEYVFGSPAQGYAQLALAIAARNVGAKATIFVARRAEPHPLTFAAHQAGAKVVGVPFGRLNVVQAAAKTYCAKTGAIFFPLGYDLAEARSALAEVAAGLNLDPPEVWCVAGTGMLSRSLQLAWPKAHHVAVQIGFPARVGKALLLKAPERFEQPAAEPPPFPSCSNYDAKAWAFITRYALPGALFWNVAA